MRNIYQAFDLAFRIAVLVFALTIGASFILFGATHARAASLKPHITLTHNVLTVGDLFAGIPEEMATRVLGPAPQPGQEMVLNARTLMRVAIAMDLPWRPASSAEQAVIRRSATTVSANMVRNKILPALYDQGLDGRFDLSFQGGEAPEIVLPGDQPATIEIITLDYSPHNGSFTAKIAAPSRSNPLYEATLRGTVEHLVSVPVLRGNVQRGDIISSRDLDWTEMKVSQLQDGFVTRAEDLVGMTPRRMAVAGRPLRDQDLERPRLVSRGDTVTILYNDGPLNLTAKGRVMQHGSKGDMVRVVNLASNRSIDAFVRDQSIVTVTP